MACPQPDVLGAFLAGDLPLTERATIADHAATCDLCRAVVAAAVSVAVTPSGGAALAAANDGLVAPGVRVGRYVIEERLGVGGMGVVYAAVDSELHRRVAVKLLRDDAAELGSHGRDRLLREARTLAKLSHPNVVTVFDVGVHDDQLYIAMELVDGGSLAAWLRREPRTTRDIVERVREAGAGLAAAHAAGVIHRDVKPDNILVGNDGRARMTDFGLARSTEVAAPAAPLPGTTPVVDAALTRTHAIVGTPVYMAPEQLAGGSADERSDQWSFCATLYEAVAGVRPFAIGDVASRRSAIAAASVTPPVHGRMPRWVRRIALRGLRADPAERWPSVAALVQALGRRRRRVALAIAAMAAIVAAAVITAVVLTRPPPPLSPKQKFFAEQQDRRDGCDCPYSVCVDGRCLGECGAPNFKLGPPVPGVSIAGTQEALLGASVDGGAILYASGERCSVNRLMLARRGADGFHPRDLTPALTAALGGTGDEILEGAATLAPDGRSVIIRTRDAKRFVRLRLGADDAVVAVDDTELANLTEPLPGEVSVASPVLSADELTLYFSIRDYVGTDAGPMNGNYESVRAGPTNRFPRATRMRGRARSYDYVTGVSSDGLALFMTQEYVSRVIMRASTTEVFGDPAPTLIPPKFYGWRAVPIEHCARVLTTDTPGGCASEDIIYLEALPKRR